jgi:hypothetical protein
MCGWQHGESSLTCWNTRSPRRRGHLHERVRTITSNLSLRIAEAWSPLLSSVEHSRWLFSRPLSSTHPPSCLPLLQARYALLSSYGGSDSRPPFTRAEGYPRFTSPEPACRSVSSHRMSFHVRFPRARCHSRSGLFLQDRFSSASIQVSGVRRSAASSPRHTAESSFSRTDRQTRLPLLSTPPLSDAVTVGFQPVERLVERLSHPPFQVRSRAHDCGGLPPPLKAVASYRSPGRGFAALGAGPPTLGFCLPSYNSRFAPFHRIAERIRFLPLG